MTTPVALALALALTLGGCAGSLRPADTTLSLSRGTSNRGWITHAAALPERGGVFVRARPREGTRFGTSRLVTAIQRAAAAVHRAFPGTPPLRVGDLSYRHGGRHPRHGSHRSGRDVDLIFYAQDLRGRPLQGRGWTAYDRLGLGRVPRRVARGGRLSRRIDLARNWKLVETLLEDEEAEVEWLFCSAGVKARLLRYAARRRVERKLYFRAAWVLHQPRNSRAHDDHFHVRLRCTPEERALGCYDRGPTWPWLAAAQNKRPSPDDESLLQALLEDPPAPSRP